MTPAEKQKAYRLRSKRGLVCVTVEVPKGDRKAVEAFALKLRRIALKREG